jgi:hypothetical protein
VLGSSVSRRRFAPAKQLYHTHLRLAYVGTLRSGFDLQNRGEKVDHYVAQLDDVVKKFSGLTATASAPKQESLAL